jgi:hypothetical protein
LDPKLDQTPYRVSVRHRDRAGFLHLPDNDAPLLMSHRYLVSALVNQAPIGFGWYALTTNYALQHLVFPASGVETPLPFSLATANGPPDRLLDVARSILGWPPQVKGMVRIAR